MVLMKRSQKFLKPENKIVAGVERFLQLQIPADRELIHLSYIPPEARTAINGLKVAVAAIQKDHLGYDQFYTIDVDDLADVMKKNDHEQAAQWFKDYFNLRQDNDDDYIPEEQRNKIFVPATAGILLNNNVE
jgi:hypothetical protein